MENPVKINTLELENVKRIRAVQMAPAANGLTVIGGRNEQGKTSVLDAIAWALGGDKYRPSQATREGSVIPPSLSIRLSNGLLVERKGKNSDLKVTDLNGQKNGQQLLNSFVEQLALDLPKFMQASNTEKASALLRIIGVEDEVKRLTQQENELYNRRRAIGQIADQKEKYAKEQPYYPDAPREPVLASELIRQQQAILAQNGENQRKRQRAAQLTAERGMLEKQLQELKARYEAVCKDLEIACMSVQGLEDQSTQELEQNITDIEKVNIKVRANLDKEKAEEDARQHYAQYDTLTHELENVRSQKKALLQNAALPLPGLSVEEGELTYTGFRWDNLSGSAQLKVATAIVRKLNPLCGFVLLDKLEQMDVDTLREFGIWLEQEGLQAIATRVSTGGECSVVIEDGYVAGDSSAPAMPNVPTIPQWKAGAF